MLCVGSCDVVVTEAVALVDGILVGSSSRAEGLADVTPRGDALAAAEG